MSLPLFALLACALQERLEALDGEPQACAQRVTVHPDADGDGLGDSRSAYVGCSPPAGWIADGTDCDDSDATLGGCDSGGAP